MQLEVLIPISSILALFVIIYLVIYISKQSTGTEKMQKIAHAVKEGAFAFLNRQYKTIAILSVIVAILLGFITGDWSNNVDPSKESYQIFNWHTLISFMVGAICSLLAGYIGMDVAVNSNIRAASAATKNLRDPLKISFRGGAVTGLAVTALSLIGVAGLFYIFGGAVNPMEAPNYIIGFAFGASFVALFAQLGGGIYTKAADVGADIVGKVEAGIPEDDHRNPAVVADLVGDNVGDCAGRGADLFESTAAENIGAMILGVALYPVFGINGILFPLVARAVGILATIIGMWFVNSKKDRDPMNLLTVGYLVTTVFCAIGLYFVTKFMLSGLQGNVNFLYFYGCAMIGLALSFVFVILTQYYTSYKYRPVKSIAQSSQTGAGTNIITGIAVGMESTAFPTVVISVAILGSYYLGSLSAVDGGGLYGTAVATMGMLSTAAYILAMDTFGPITDNAGGIAEMGEAPEEVRERTDALDAAGNTTKALTKGYAIGSAALATFLLFSAYVDEVKRLIDIDSFPVDIGKPEVFTGAFIGAMVVFLFSSTAMRAVGRAAQYVIMEVRRQFKEMPGIKEDKVKPDYAKCVDIVTKGALKEMVLPGLIVVVAPVLVGVTLGAEAAAGFLMVGTITGVLVALFLNNGGGAWDNAKKYIELGNYGGKNSLSHDAGIVGDTVGDPFKDTAGPSLHVLVKLISTVTLLLAVLFVN